MSSNLPFSNSRLLDRFYKIYLSVAAVLLLVGVPFVFHRKLAAGVAISLLSLLIGWCWHLNRQGLAKQSIVFFATGIWFIMMGLTFGGMPPPTGGAIVITLMLAIVVHMRAAAIFAVSYMLGWLVYIVLRTLQVLPEPYFPGNPITTWFVGAIAIGLVLLPVPDLVNRLRRASFLQHAVIEAATDGILAIGLNGEIETHNQRFVELWELPQRGLDEGKHRDLVALMAQQLYEPDVFLRRVQELLSKPEEAGFDTLRCKSGRVLEQQSIPQRMDGQVAGRVWSYRDITERESSHAEIHRLAFHDSLTLLPNRRMLTDRLQKVRVAQEHYRSFGALLLIDLDNFKTLNDTLGHDQGDLLLQQVGQRLSGCVRSRDMVARLGGDEFVVMLDGLADVPEDAAAQAEGVGDKILNMLNQPYSLSTQSFSGTPSIGITLFCGVTLSNEELLKQADLAMYQAKAAGRNTMRFFDPEMQAIVSGRAQLEADLREGLKQSQFMLYYQPQVVGDGRLTGVEALIRWQHPERGMVSPLEFIPLAEEIGLILPLGKWVLESACAQLAAWAQQPDMEHLTIAVNVSAKQLHLADFVDQVLAVVARTGANPQRLKLELTESLLVTQVESTIAKMTHLKAHGIGFSLDDFGTGYSSLSYLKRLPLDQMKIDQSFVREVLTDPNDAAIAKMVVALAQSMGLTVIAEGVELEEQRVFLAQLGCHAYQGYLFCRPLPLEGFEAFARNTPMEKSTEWKSTSLF